MSEKDVSIAFKASDNLTNAVRQMQSNVNNLTKDVEGYRKIQDKAFGKKAEVKLDITKAQQELKELGKAVKQNVEGAEEAFKKKRKELELLNEEYRRLSQAANEAAKAERNLSDDIKKSSNANASRGGLIGDLGGAGGLLSALGTAGMGMMLGNAIQSNLDAAFSSSMGANIGGAVSNVVGGVASGAAMGSIAGPIGAAVGAAVGGLTGAINALTDKQQRMDDLFREEVKDLYTNAISDSETKLKNSSGVSAEREIMQEKFKAMMGDEAGQALFNDLKRYGIDTPYSTDAMLNAGTQFRRYNSDWDAEDIKKNIGMVGDLAMGDQNAFNAMSYAYAQIQSEGKLNGQDWRQLTQAGFNPLEILAKERGKSQAYMRDLMSDGLISAEDVTHAFEVATSEGGDFFQGAEKLMDSFTGISAQLEDTKLEIDLAMGEAFNEARKQGMEKELEAYNGDMSEKMKEAYSMIGAYEGEMENQYQQSIIDAINNVYASDEYKDAVANGDGLEAERLMWEAKTQAEIEYKNSEEYQKKLMAEKDLVGNIQDALIESGDYVKFGEQMANEFSKGWNKNLTTNIQDSMNNLRDIKIGNGKKENGYATGLPRVPADGYYFLHEGEGVNTEVDTNKNAGGSIQIAKLADSIVVREEGDIDRIASALVEKLIGASTVYGGRVG